MQTHEDTTHYNMPSRDVLHVSVLECLVLLLLLLLLLGSNSDRPTIDCCPFETPTFNCEL